jgi:glucosamine--fructose-6-phosphate aminotransferase (isomerizing)
MQELLAEIHEQPQVLSRILEQELVGIRDLAAEISGRGMTHVLIAARGTSDHAATYAKYLFGMANGLPVGLAAPSLYTLYERPPRLCNTLVIGVSQSGMSPDIVAVIDNAREQGMLTVAITNDEGSRLALAAECLIRCQAGVEHSVAATKTYTAELMALAMLSVSLADDREGLEQLQAVPAAVAEALRRAELVAEMAQRYRDMTSCAVIGRGYNYATAFEAALKIKELTYSNAMPYSSADFLHGPIAVVGEGYPVILCAPSGRALKDMLDLATVLRQRGGELIVLSDHPQALQLAQTAIPLPGGVAEWLSPFTAIVPAQLFAAFLAQAKGLDPENPRGLHKVTETR